MIEVENLCVSLGTGSSAVDVLRGLNMRVGRGERVAIVGPSGSGKSTLLSVLAGLETPTSGRVVVAGQDYAGLSQAELTAHRGANIGIIFQSFHLLAGLNALENIMLPLELSGAADTQRGQELLEAVGLGERGEHLPSQLSGGEQQRVAIARALITAPQLLLADEPTGNLDQQTGGRVLDLLMRLSETHNTTLLLITHDSGVAARCDRVVEMRDGKIL